MIFTQSATSTVGSGTSKFFGNAQATGAVGRPAMPSAWAANQQRMEKELSAPSDCAQTVIARATAFLTSRSSSDCKAGANNPPATPKPRPRPKVQMKLCGGKLVMPSKSPPKKKPAGKKGKKNEAKSSSSRAQGGRHNSAFTTASDNEEDNAKDIGDKDEWSQEEEGELSDDFCDDRSLSDLTECSDDDDEIDKASVRELARVRSDTEEEEEQQEEILRYEDATEEESSEWSSSTSSSDEEEEEKEEKIPVFDVVKLTEMPVLLQALFQVVDNPTDRSLSNRSEQQKAIKVLEANFIPYEEYPEILRDQFQRDFFTSKPNATAAEEVRQFTKWHAVYAQTAKLASSINRNRKRGDKAELRKIDESNAIRYAKLTKEPRNDSSSEIVDLTAQESRWIETRPYKQHQHVVVSDAEEEIEEKTKEEEEEEEGEAPDLEDLNAKLLECFEKNALLRDENASWSAFVRDLFALLFYAEEEDAVGFASAGLVYGDEWWVATSGKGPTGYLLATLEGMPNPGRAVRVPNDLDPRVLRLSARVLRLRDAALRLHKKSSPVPVKVMGWFRGSRKNIRAKQAITLVPCPEWMEIMLRRAGCRDERDLSSPTGAQLVRAICSLGDS